MMMFVTEPAWIDVLVDLLMSALSQDQNLTRVVINSAFVYLVPHLTITSLRLILDVSIFFFTSRTYQQMTLVESWEWHLAY